MWEESIYLGKDCFLTLEEAKVKADEMKNKKMSSLHKQIKKLERLNFGA